MERAPILKRALAIGWRILFVSTVIATMAAATVWWLAPDIKTLRPQIESYLKKELDLQDVKLGWLSWYWAGHLGITSDECSFKTGDGSFEVKRGRIAVYFSTWNLIRGDFLPDSIHLHDGEMDLTIEGGEPVIVGGLPPVTVVLDNMHLNWQVKGYEGEITGMTFRASGEEGHLLLRFPGLHAEAYLDEHALPVRVEGEFLDVKWIPAPLLSGVDGVLAGKFSVARRGENSWHGGISLSSAEGAKLSPRNSDFTLLFDSFEADFGLQLQNDSSTNVPVPVRINIDHFKWGYQDNQIAGSAVWESGRLKLSASTSHVEMPLLWSWLKPLDDGDWDLWLDKMEAGLITKADAEVVLEWPAPMRALPSMVALEAMKYHVKGTVEGADIALGLDEGSIINTRGDVELDEQGLRADINHTELAEASASAAGSLQIPWDTLVLEVQGKGTADAGKLHAWLDEDGAAALNWQGAMSAGDFKLKWMPEEDGPREAAIHLKPEQPWQLMPNGVPIVVHQGGVSWQLSEGLTLTSMEVKTPYLAGTVSAQAVHRDGSPWKITSFNGSAEGGFSQIARQFHLPIEAPAGNISLRLSLNEKWQGNIDFSDAAWVNLLGMKKTIGQKLEANFLGSSSTPGVLSIEEIVCRDKQLQLLGDGLWSNAGLKLNLRRVQTEGFNGAVKVNAPFGPDPWELDVDAQFLNRAALPNSLGDNVTSNEKPWALRASIGDFLWGDARMNKVSIRLASARNSAGVFKAKHITTEMLKLDNISALFALPGSGKVDLRHFTASIDKLKLVLSASLTPESEGGVHWRGFATLQGNFGQMMKRAELSSLFEDGDMKVLFSGQGVLLREQPWWEGLSGRLRLRVDDGRIMKGGTLSKLLAAVNILELPAVFSGDRKDLTEKGLFYRRLQGEALMQGKSIDMKNFVLRSSAMDIAGHGTMDVHAGEADMIFVARPFQNLDALLAKVPIIRDLIGGSAHSFVRRVYRLHGKIADAVVEQVSPQAAGLEAPGLVEQMLSLPDRWFGAGKKQAAQ